MWKSGFSLRTAITFFPQEIVKNKVVFPQEKMKRIEEKFSTEIFSTFHKALWKNYRQELILALISRMWFCKLVSPAFKALSTLLME